ncbi:hypothetical protein AB4Y64_04370 [Lysobacter sp. TAF61]|uniref:hypothetical protein n=1 Tax=Lysobacter sp. TAF61 TaxID=3233072 RepID=UPI003F95CC2F
MRNLLLSVVALALLLTACAKPVPPAKADYVGEWRSQTMALLITQDGSVVYKRLEAGVSKSVEGPLQGFDGDDFSVGLGPIKTTFVVSRPPYQAQGEWKMVVDDVELTRVKEG